MFVTARIPVAAVAGTLLSLAVAVVAQSAGWWAFAITNLVLAGLIAADVAAAEHPSRMSIRRELPAVMSLGRREEVVLRIAHTSSTPVRVWLRDSSPPSMNRGPMRHRILAPPEGARAISEVKPSRRGRMRLGPLTVRCEGPLGLGGRQASLPLFSVVKVYPALPSRAQVELRLDRARLLQVGERSTKIRGGGTEFESLREYHPDDEFRRINWPATARSGKPISNHYREERNQQVFLLLDAGRMMAGSVEGASRFEHAIDAAVAVAEMAARVGDHVGMTAFHRQVAAFVGPRGGKAQPRIVLDQLYDLDPTLDSPNYRTAFATLLSRHRRRALLVLLTELTEQSAMESLFQAIPALLGRHLVIVGAVRDPGLDAAVALVPEDAQGAYLKAAASQILLDRAVAASRLRRLGVTVVDRPPRRLAGELADHYLRIKAFGRL
jgi:uncharacterized protein (DUF58 family)